MAGSCWTVSTAWTRIPPLKPHTMTYRGKERLVEPYYTVEDYRRQYELKWRGLEPLLRSYYQKS